MKTDKRSDVRGRAGLCGLLFLLLTLQGCIYVSGRGLLDLSPRPLEETVLEGKGRDKILVMEIRGLISEREKSGLFNLRQEPSTVASVREQLDRAAGDDRIKGVLLLLDSPGGTVTASDILYKEIQAFKADRDVKITALLAGMATSGAYYVAMAADRIVAYPTTMTGSIGVILLNINLGGLMNKIGLSDQSVTSGAYKDLGSPFRQPRAGEREILQGIVDELHGQFVQVVRENRKGLNLDEHPELTDGRIFTAQQAQRLGLVDQIGYFSDALDGIREAAGLSQARVIRYKRGGEFLPNVYAAAGGAGIGGDVNLIKLDLEGILAASGPTFLYLWYPGL